MNTPELVSVSVEVNGACFDATVEARKTLADFLREDLGFTGVNLGCEHGVCGACSVLLDGAVVRSCIMFAGQADGAKIVTIEGLARGGKLHPVQRAFLDHHALQCGFCTPGMVLAAVDLLRRNANPTAGEIREALAGNLCMCTGYVNIVRAVKAAAQILQAERAG
ncbi:MAG TPA: (2Fe-2S)-binding protein [Candidatus Acidoferrales bacterium]|nr:(2Fe-2S)-binding protein [Candidatus Acidoferrales bacterium]